MSLGKNYVAALWGDNFRSLYSKAESCEELYCPVLGDPRAKLAVFMEDKFSDPNTQRGKMV